MTLRFFNTLSRSLEDFTPLVPRAVGLYTCGPTIYNRIHIGNLRTFVWEDVLCRALRYLGHRTTQVMNLTDVEDKIIRKSRESGIPFKEYTRIYAEAFFEDLATLNTMGPSR